MKLPMIVQCFLLHFGQKHGVSPLIYSENHWLSESLCFPLPYFLFERLCNTWIPPSLQILIWVSLLSSNSRGLHMCLKRIEVVREDKKMYWYRTSFSRKNWNATQLHRTNLLLITWKIHQRMICPTYLAAH